jgi:cytochrome P450
VNDPPRFPFPEGPGIEPPVNYHEVTDPAGLLPVTLSTGFPALLVTRYEDVKTVLSDPGFSRAAYGGKSLFARERRSLALAMSDPPDHTRRRSAVARAFTARQAAQARPYLTQLAGALLSELRAAGSAADLVSGFCLPFPIAVMCRMLGLPFDDWPRFRPWVDAMMSASRYPPDHVARAHQHMYDYVAGIADATHTAVLEGETPEGLLAELLAPGGHGAPLSRDEIVVLVAGLLMAGYETTSNQLAICVYLMLSRAPLARSLRDSPQDVAPAIEEMLRWTSFMSTGGPPHAAAADVPLAGTVVPEGQVVVPVVDAANRDPQVYSCPAEIMVDRAQAPHLAFGHGRHYCLGAHLARAELQVAMTCLLAEFPDLELAVPAADIRWRRGMLVRGPQSLPVRWEQQVPARETEIQE